MAADAKPSTSNPGANEKLPAAAVAANRRFFPGLRQSVLTTEGVEVRGRKASGAVINTLVGGKGPLFLIHGHPETPITWRKA